MSKFMQVKAESLEESGWDDTLPTWQASGEHSLTVFEVGA
jgi:hypothetical protein